ncbi:MAG TPA: MBL fold metallo-hydrolase [Terriglobia bacterium]
MKPESIPDARLGAPQAGAFVQAIGPNDLVYFLCNVGDGDSQVVLLPERTINSVTRRRIIVVDVATVSKVIRLINAINEVGLLGPQGIDPGTIALAVATHPHEDHIGGMEELLTTFKGKIAEFWDSGYYHSGAAYIAMMNAIAEDTQLVFSQPTSGLRRWIDNVVVTVISPSIQLRNRYDSYGVEINDSSISLRLEFPASRVRKEGDERHYLRDRVFQSLILGADAQTESWAAVFQDFPRLLPSESPIAKQLNMARGGDELRANVLKVSHHASKHGVNLELVERLNPNLTLISSVGDGGSYRFPHTVSQELIREAKQALASKPNNTPRSKDHDLGIFYTSDTTQANQKLGTIAVIMDGSQKRQLWRFCDDRGERINFDRARLWL